MYVFHLLENCPDGYVIIDGLCCLKGQVVDEGYTEGLICTCKGEYSNGECIPCPDGTVSGTWDGQCVACPNGQIEVDGVCKHGTDNSSTNFSWPRTTRIYLDRRVLRPIIKPSPSFGFFSTVI